MKLKNLDLIGDNNHTHYHDDRYLPLIDKEKSDRIAADDAITKDLTAKLEENKTVINQTINNIQNSMSNKIDDAIQQEVINRNQAIQQEANARAEADKQLENSINSLNPKLNQEIQDRISADNKLSTDINNLKNQISKEITDRGNADNSLTDQIKNVTNLLGSHNHDDRYVKVSEVANAANKIPKYNAEGHLVLPNGAEFWISGEAISTVNISLVPMEGVSYKINDKEASGVIEVTKGTKVKMEAYKDNKLTSGLFVNKEED